MGVKVYMRDLSYHATEEDKERAFKGMFAAFKRLVNESGILTEYSRKQYYESPSEKKRRKKKEARMSKRRDLSHSEWREYFGRGNEDGQ